MPYSLGLDIGSVNAKLVLIDGQHSIVHRDVERIGGNPRLAVNALLTRLLGSFDSCRIDSAGVSGSGKNIIPDYMTWGTFSSSLSTASGVLQTDPGAKTIIHIGGQSSLLMELADGLNKPWKVASNSLCASGTGRFLEQQAYRLGISLEDFASLALKSSGTPPRIAARCSVFAKSDLIHLQQKGTPVEDLLYALCESVARMVVSLKQGSFVEPVNFVGGVAANAAVVRSLQNAIAERNRRVVNISVPPDSLFVQALGSALLAGGKSSRVELLAEDEADSALKLFAAPALPEVAVPAPGSGDASGVTPAGYLGVDVGSTSTKAVVMDESGKTVLYKHYLMTAGRPVDAIKEVFRNLLAQGAGSVNIKAAGVTGSGRYLVAGFIGSDLIKNEITAQSRAGAEIDAGADIIEIGGQDSKLILKRHGVVVDYRMNKACAAGTGSFIDELAEMLGVSVRNGEFSDMAFTADHTVDLGTRCAAFMGQAVNAALQQGESLAVVVASLASSIARNYLSKVVGSLRLGQKIILTGAVFYNRAVVAAFTNQLPEKNLMVAEHREVSGAIGAALLAKEAHTGAPSQFRGFEAAIKGECQLSTFTCRHCVDNCVITTMKMSGNRTAFYGSRCERYDGLTEHIKQKTAFDEREELLLRGYDEAGGSGVLVGVPRALLVYDLAPLVLGFLNSLGVRVRFSSKTSRDVLERSIELSYSDSCFPLKILHGHVDSLSDADFIFYPSAIRLGMKDGNENQKYSCPLVQASPFIIDQAFDLGERLITPFIDFSQGDRDVVEELAGAAVKLGFNRKRGREAALAGIAAQRKFEKDQQELGQELLAELRNSGKLGVVLVSRSYMAQDSGANLGVAERLAQLGVVPVPLDFLPLGTVEPKLYSDRPYWFYESKFIAATAIVAADSRLYGLALTNFGCGPNSFTLKMLEDISGPKPFGELEIDEHAAEAGVITRLEAFVDTIQDHARASSGEGQPPIIYRGIPSFSPSDKVLLLPRMVPHAEVMAAVMATCGVNAMVLPEADERNLVYSNRVTSGAECLPYRVTLGDFMRFYYDGGASDFKNVEGFMAGSYGPCRLGKYATEQRRILQEIGFDIVIRASVSNNAYRDLNLGEGFERRAWKGIVTVDYLQQLLWKTRPYEREKGTANRLFSEYLTKIATLIRQGRSYDETMRQARADFDSTIDPSLPKRPRVGINGEIFLRGNSFSNNRLVETCENLGLEVMVSSMGEWFNYTSHRNLEDAVKDRNVKKMVTTYLKNKVQGNVEKSVARNFGHEPGYGEPAVGDVLAESARYLSNKCGSEAVLSLGTGIEWLKNGEFAGVISVMPHGCMPGGIVAAMADKISSEYQKPWISLTYDGFSESNNLTRISDFVELVKICRDCADR